MTSVETERAACRPYTRGSTISDYISLETDAGNALVLRRSAEHIAEIDGIIFDFDGVLVDVRDSIRLVHSMSAETFFGGRGWSNCEKLVFPSDVDAFKLAGGFNSDWELAYTWCLLYLFKSERYGSMDGAVLRAADPVIDEFAAGLAGCGGINAAVAAVRDMCRSEEWAAIDARWAREDLQRLFVETYSGDLCREVYGFDARVAKGQGMIHRDRPLLKRECLPGTLKLGIATGRTRGEAVVGVRLMGWADLFPEGAIVTEDDGFLKPDPRVLDLAVERVGARRPIYIGDTPDDTLTVRRYNALHGGMLSCAVLSGLNHAGLRERFIEEQVDLIADNVNAALEAVSRCKGGVLCLGERRR